MGDLNKALDDLYEDEGEAVEGEDEVELCQGEWRFEESHSCQAEEKEADGKEWEEKEFVLEKTRRGMAVPVHVTVF